jgi:hypothetical protein
MNEGAMDQATKRLTERSGETRIVNGAIYEDEIRYCWVDEDGARVSPVHKDFGKALSVIADWPAMLARVQRWQDELDEKRREKPDSELGDANYERNNREREEKRITEAMFKITRTGKPPVQLKRLVIRTLVEDLEEHEAATVGQTFLSNGMA